jgi:hypothetical protein
VVEKRGISRCRHVKERSTEEGRSVSLCVEMRQDRVLTAFGIGEE